MTTYESRKPFRIATICGRYLVFDPAVAGVLRREVNTSGTLVGTAPQQPTQNIFLGLPIELRPEEVCSLVQKEVAYIVDDVAAHILAFRLPDAKAKTKYIDGLRTRKQAATRVLAQINASKALKTAGSVIKATKALEGADFMLPEITDHPFRNTKSDCYQSSSGQFNFIGITPTSSDDYPALDRNGNTGCVHWHIPFCQYLHTAGCYISPGLRFGSRYSVYPGDPLRFHAHFMANFYDWEEEIPLLDLVGGGRLATAVKKAFLLGGSQPTENKGASTIRSFSIEWAGM